MPLYEYSCGKCGQDFTLLQSNTVDKNNTICVECGSSNVRPKLSTFASKVQGPPRSRGTKPATADNYPNKDIFKLPIPRLRSEL